MARIAARVLIPMLAWLSVFSADLAVDQVERAAPSGADDPRLLWPGPAYV